MDDQLTTIEKAVQALLASNEAMRIDIAKLQVQAELVTRHYATKTDLEKVRASDVAVKDKMHYATRVWTWQMACWMAVVCTALTAATYFIARNYP